MSPQTERHYQGRFSAPKKKTARMTGAAVLLLVLLLSLVRLGAEAFKLLSYADLFIGGRNMLIYGEVNAVDIGKTVKEIPIYNELPSSEPEEDYIVRLNDGTTIVYQGRTYELNRNLATILFLGIDHKIHDAELVGDGGQSDVILLIAMDTKTGKTRILNISRDTYAEVEAYAADGVYMGTKPLQITTAFAYGNGKETSCENAVRSVSRLLYNLPIHSYLALDMNGIQAANEAVGHVTVKALDDIEMTDGTKFKKGDPIELQGPWLDRYLRTRSKKVVDANAKRMERQVQYVQAFSKLVVEKSKASLSFPVDLFSALAPYMVTNLDIPDVTFLSSTFLSHGAEFTLRSITGTYGVLNSTAVLYPDELDLFEAVLELFYLPVD